MKAFLIVRITAALPINLRQSAGGVKLASAV